MGFMKDNQSHNKRWAEVEIWLYMANKYFKSKNDLRKLNPKCRIQLLVKYITDIEEELRNSSQNSKLGNREMKKKDI